MLLSYFLWILFVKYTFVILKKIKTWYDNEEDNNDRGRKYENISSDSFL